MAFTDLEFSKTVIYSTLTYRCFICSIFLFIFFLGFKLESFSSGFILHVNDVQLYHEHDAFSFSSPSLSSSFTLSSLTVLIMCCCFLGMVSMLDCNIFPGLDRDYLETEVNLFLLPVLENDGDEALTRAGQNNFFFSYIC